MLKAFELERLKDQRFYSEKVKGFVTIAGTRFTFNNRTIDLKKVSILDTETQDLISDILYESKTKYRLEKRTSRAFEKNIFLLGKDVEGKLMWLEEPKWDCGWYWGFGYIETYTNKLNPSKARNIESHSHFSGLVGYQEYYDHDKECFRKGEYIHNVYDSPRLIETCFSSAEGWQLSELFKQFYLLKDMAEYTHRSPASCNLTTSPVTQDPEKMAQWHKEINEVMIPLITAEILRILTP
jgi:hypothetical protein